MSGTFNHRSVGLSYRPKKRGKISILGKVVREVDSGTQPAGTYEVSFDAAGLPSGVYLYTLTVGRYSETRKMVLLR